jgi:hypothetical protein
MTAAAPAVASVAPSMAVELDPPNFIEDAARDEGWTAADRRHWQKMHDEAFKTVFEVKMLQRDATSVYAYGSRYSNFESVAIDPQDGKPVLRALSELSKALLRLKTQSERST